MCFAMGMRLDNENLLTLKAQRIQDHRNRTERHRCRSDHRAKFAHRRDRNGNGIVAERPKQILFDDTQGGIA